MKTLTDQTALQELAKSDQDESVRQAATARLGELGKKEAEGKPKEATTKNTKDTASMQNE